MPQERETARPPRARRWWIVLLLIAALAGGAALWRPFAAGPPMVAVETASPGPVVRVLAVNGLIAAETSVNMRSAVSATVLELLAGEGDRVAAGDVLVRLDASQQDTVVRQAASALQQGLVLQAQAADTYRRSRDLGALIARNRLEEESRALAVAAQEAERLRALLDQAQLQLARYVLVAPFAGTVISRLVDPGQLVDPATPVLTLADLSRLLVEADVDEAYATQIALGQSATLQLIGSRETLPGQVVFVSPRVDSTTGGRAVKIGFDQPVAAPVGLTVTANIVVESTEAITVPRTALSGDAVFVLVAGRATLTPVQVIDWPAARLIVTEGLQPGDQVIVDAAGIADGMAVAAQVP